MLVDVGKGSSFLVSLVGSEARPGKTGYRRTTARPREGYSVKNRHLANGIQVYGVA